MSTRRLDARVSELEERRGPGAAKLAEALAAAEREEREAREAYEGAYAAIGGEATWRELLGQLWGSPLSEGESADYHLEAEEWAELIARRPAIAELMAARNRLGAAAFDVHIARVLARSSA